LHLPSFSTNLVSTAALQDAMVTTTTPGGQRVSICTCTRTGRHLATITHRPWSSMYTLATEPPQVAVSAQVSASGPVAASCSSSQVSASLTALACPVSSFASGSARTFLSCVSTLTEVVSSSPTSYGTLHAMALRPSSVPLRVPLPPPHESSLPEVPDSESYRARAPSPTFAHLLATIVTDPSFESAAASALVAELLDFAASCRLDYATASCRLCC
ncbi:unnamed protein product, partial [Closterium sp. NIES-54]